ncbi:MAG: hypothetical protein FWG54_05990 [Bacteroidetes bacterium]|nr:hypothetical protein [Bacteroidota bacterium]
MKISNYIIAAFFVAVAGGTLGMFINAKHHEHESDNRFTTTEYALPDFWVIMAQDSVSFSIDGAGGNHWTVYHEKEAPVNSEWYQVQGDTLFVASHTEFHPVLHIEEISEISILVTEKSHIDIRNIKADRVMIASDHGFVTLRDNNQIKSLEATLFHESSLRSYSRNHQKVTVEKDSSSRYSLY